MSAVFESVSFGNPAREVSALSAASARSVFLSVRTPAKLTTGDHHAGSTLSVLRRPLRRSPQLLQKGDRRRRENGDALEGQSRQKHVYPGKRRQSHACTI